MGIKSEKVNGRNSEMMGITGMFRLDNNVPLPEVKRPLLADLYPDDWQRGHDWGRYNKSRRDPEMIAKFLKTFEPRNKFDRGYMEGLSYGH